MCCAGEYSLMLGGMVVGMAIGKWSHRCVHVEINIV